MLDFRQPDDTDVLFEIGRLESTHPIQIQWPHRHTFYEIIWATGGAGVHAADFEEHTIEPQTVFLVSPGQVHAMRVDRPLSGYMLAFTSDFFVLDGRAADAVADLPFFRVGAANPVLALADEEAALLRLIAEDLLAEFTSRSSWRREMLRAHTPESSAHHPSAVRRRLERHCGGGRADRRVQPGREHGRLVCPRPLKGTSEADAAACVGCGGPAAANGEDAG